LAIFTAIRRASSRVRIGSPSQAARSDQDRWSNGHHGLVPDALARRCLKCLVGDFLEDIFVRFVGFGGDIGAVIHGDYPYCICKWYNSSGSLAMLAAMHRASSRVSRLAAHNLSAW
jgi:hypothetical protein